jgi:hypothetical protein
MMDYASCQWITKLVDNGIDEKYRISYCMASSKTSVLKLETVDSAISLYLTGSYYCDDYLTIDIGLAVNGETKRYSFESYKSSDSKTIFIIDNLLDLSNSDFLRDFKNSSQLNLRVNESHCEISYYKFNMSGSTNAIAFMSKSIK